MSRRNLSFEDEMLERLTLVAGLLACLVRNVEDQGEQIAILDGLGLSSTVIAKFLGVKPVTVRTSLHRMRTARKRTQKR